MKYDVFISYSSHDQKVVEGLSAYLEQHKIRCFVAYRDIPRGVVWARAIVEALDESRMMVVVFSDHFNNSDQVDREIELACEDHKPILTFRITDDAFKGAKKYYLKNINWIDASPNPAKVFGSVVDNVAKLLDMDISVPPPTPSPKPDPQPEPRQEPTRTYNVGDYYNENGLEGVVFDVWDGGKHGKIISLDETKAAWDSRVKFDYDKGDFIRGTRTYADSQIDGMANTDKIMARSDSIYFNAFKWCREKGSRWYLPTYDELKQIYNIRDKLYYTLSQCKGSLIVDDCYWSSSELVNYKSELSAWLVGMSGGTLCQGSKGINYYVRAVAIF